MNQTTVQIDASESIQLSWQTGWTNFTIQQNGQVIVNIPTWEELKLGRNFNTAGGKSVYVIQRKIGLEIWYEGRDLMSGLESGSSNYFQHACNTLFATGGVLVVLGLIVVYSGWGQHGRLSIFSVVFLILYGALHLFMGWWAKKTGKTFAFRAALITCIPVVFLALSFGILGAILIGSAIYFYLIKGLKSKPIRSLEIRKLGENSPLDSGI